MSASPRALSERAEAAIRDGNPIEAIRLVRQETGLGLKEAKDLVDAHIAGRPVLTPSDASAPTAFPMQAILALQNGSRIDAIRCVREARGIGLKAARQVVDAYVDAHPDALPARAAGGSAMQGKLALFVVIAALLGLAGWWWLA